MTLFRLLLKMLFALFGLYALLSAFVLILAASSQQDPNSRTALRIVASCFIATSLPFLVAVASTGKAKMVAAVLLVPASMGIIFLTFTPSLQPDQPAIALPVLQIAAIVLATLLFARILDYARSHRVRVGT